MKTLRLNKTNVDMITGLLNKYFSKGLYSIKYTFDNVNNKGELKYCDLIVDDTEGITMYLNFLCGNYMFKLEVFIPYNIKIEFKGSMLTIYLPNIGKIYEISFQIIKKDKNIKQLKYPQIRSYRIIRHMLLKDMAEQLGISSADLSAFEWGKKDIPDLETKLKNLYGISLKEP